METLGALLNVIAKYLNERQSTGPNAPLLRDRLLGNFTHNPREADELIRAALEMGIVSEHDLDPRELPGELPVVLFGFAGAPVKVMLIGVVCRQWDGKPDVSGLKLVLVDTAEPNSALVLTVYVEGKVNPYLRVCWKPIERHFRTLWDFVVGNGLVANIDPLKTRQVYLTRLVAAAAGKDVAGMETHHDTLECWDLFGGFKTLDCRADVLWLMSKVDHSRFHRQLGDEHFHNLPAEVLAVQGGLKVVQAKPFTHLGSICSTPVVTWFQLHHRPAA